MLRQTPALGVHRHVSERVQTELEHAWLLARGAPGQYGHGRKPHHDFKDAISIVVLCDDDRYGLRWQIVPSRFDAMMTDAMLRMVKFDIAALEKAYRSCAGALRLSR
jgi:hypothetical protein